MNDDYPENSNSELWQLQLMLLKEAESLLGPKNPNKKIYHPVFNNKQPHIINTPNLDGAFASLSSNSKKYWPTATYELAHETIHLLDPVPGSTNVLEEGFAVWFSLDMSKKYYPASPQTPSIPSYIDALNLVKNLPEGLNSGRHIREKFGSLGNAEETGMIELFSTVSKNVISKLCAQFK